MDIGSIFLLIFLGALTALVIILTYYWVRFAQYMGFREDDFDNDDPWV